MTPRQVSRLRRALAAVAAVSALWAAILALTGGFVIDLFGLQITSRNPRNPLWLLAVSAVAAWALPMPDRRAVLDRAWRRVLAWIDSPRPLTQRLRWADPAALIALSFGAVDVVLWLGARPLWLDEQMIALNVRDRALADLAGPLWLGQTAPLGWLVLERASVVALGTGELALRLVPLLIGIVMLSAAVCFGRRMLSPLGAALFVLLCAAGPFIAHYRLEFKHYSADALWGLLLPALAVWAMEPLDAAARRRRSVLWWVVAAAGQWFSYGAMLAAPGCALALLTREWTLTRWCGAGRASLAGVVWLASFVLHYQLSLRFTAESAFLRDYWVGGFPPASAGLGETLVWLTGRLTPLADNPAGTEWAFGFWMSALAGLMLTGWPGAAMLSLPLSAFVLAGARLVPLSDRLAIWALPVLYFGVVRCLEAGVGALGRPGAARGLRLAAAVLAAGLVLPVCAGIVTRGWSAYRGARGPHSNQGVHDRASIEWLLNERQEGSAIITTHFGTPAVWWYGDVPLAGAGAGASLRDGTPIFEVSYDAEGRCDGRTLDDALTGVRRVLIHFGFPDRPEGFPDLLLDTLSRRGAVVAERRFDLLGHAIVVSLGTPQARQPVQAGDAANGLAATGCISAAQARRW
jgi:hypothetical protein